MRESIIAERMWGSRGWGWRLRERERETEESTQDKIYPQEPVPIDLLPPVRPYLQKFPPPSNNAIKF
jgi:hypothetical protein